MDPPDEEGWYRPVRRQRNFSEAFLVATDTEASNTIAQEIIPRTVSPISSDEENDDNPELAKKLKGSLNSIRSKPTISNDSNEKKPEEEVPADVEAIVDILAEEFQTEREAFNYFNSKATLEYRDIRNERNNDCFSVRVDQQGKKIVVDDLKYDSYHSKNCEKKGDELLRGLKKVADQLKYDLYIGTDASYFNLQDEDGDIFPLDMATYQMLTSDTGKSYYNQQQFYGIMYEDDQLTNTIARQTPLRVQIESSQFEFLKNFAKKSPLQQEVAQELTKNPNLTVQAIGQIVKKFVNKKRKEKESYSTHDRRFINSLLLYIKPVFQYGRYSLKYNPAIL